MKVYINSKTLSLNNQKLLQEDLNVPFELNSSIISDVLVTVYDESNKATQKTLFFILEDITQKFEEHVKDLFKDFEEENLWIIFFVVLDDLDKGTEMSLRLFEMGCDEGNVMIFPVFDYFEVKDWLVDFVQSQCKKGFGELQDVRNMVLLEGIVECREGFTRKVNKSKAINESFCETFMENPGLSVDTYFPKETESEHFFIKEDFTTLLKKKFPLYNNNNNF